MVLVTLDTLRADRLGCYGYERPTSPNLDALAKRGVRFSDAVAQAISTPPSHASILTGLNPPAHGLRRLWGQSLAQQNLTLAEILRDRGFVRAAFVSGRPLDRRSGLDQGFSIYDDSLPGEAAERVGTATNAAVRSWLAQREPGRLFLWVHYFDPHWPYRAPRAHRKRFLRSDPRDRRGIRPMNANEITGSPRVYPPSRAQAGRELYDAEVAYMDEMVGELLALLDREGILSEAIIAVVADHGECLGEHGYFFGHWDVFEETARVPMILVHPGRSWRGISVEQTVRTIDLFPTILSWLKVPLPGPVDGRDLTPLIEGIERESRPAYTEQLEYFGVRSIRRGDMLLIHRLSEGEGGTGESFTAYERGPLALRELRALPPSQLEALRSQLRALAETTTAHETVESEVPQEAAEQLRALGYVE
ncbi:MAG: sulfatase [Deltaproteobacteria bacterium]|nr:sulfatase [Deltaproteobacteria bacterium]